MGYPDLGMVRELLGAPWRAKAACSGKGPSWFFIEAGAGPGRAGPAQAAKDVCKQCPVLFDCLAYAIDSSEPDGIFGGAAPRVRIMLKRARRKCPHGGVEPVAGCMCEWCVALRRHVRWLDGEVGAGASLNGEGATHGIRVTYARGCRCNPCTFAASVWGVAVRRLGVQPLGFYREEGGEEPRFSTYWSSVEVRDFIVDAMTGLFRAFGLPVERGDVAAATPDVQLGRPKTAEGSAVRSLPPLTVSAEARAVSPVESGVCGAA